MAKSMNLRVWRESKEWTQADLADKIGDPRPTYQKRESGVSPIPPGLQAKIRKLGYTGPWPREEAPKETPAGVTRDDIIELRTALKAHIEYWERGEEKVLRRLEDALQRIAQLEKRAGISE